jgi:ketosteroid isomerase-like protein
VAREMLAKQMKRLREEHQKQVFSDTERLVQLATALKSEVDKGDKSASDVMKEVDEIGKLAKRVSDRIKTQ